MSPVSRGRNGRQRPRRNPGPSDGGAVDTIEPLVSRYYRGIFAAIREMEIETEPLDAELAVSRVLGHLWRSLTDPGDTEEAVCLGLVGYATEQHTPFALALLRTLAVVAPLESVRQAAAARAAHLTAHGVREPRWPVPVGAVELGRCWANEDVYGDQTSVVCEFLYGTAAHAIVALVDHNVLGVAKSVFPVDRVEATVRELRREAMKNGPMITLREADPHWAAALLRRAFARTDMVLDPPIDEDFADWRAFALARIRAMPEPALKGPPGSWSLPGAPAPLTEAQRRTLIRQFLRSPEGQELDDSSTTQYVAKLIVDYGCDNGDGQADRISPIRWEIFLLRWLPRRVVLEAADRRAMGPVARAWAAFAARRTGLPAQAREEISEALDRLLAEFDREYDKPANFGPARLFLNGVGRLDDADGLNDLLERRMMAMPFIGTTIGADDYPRLDPGDPAAMRLLVLGEHPEYHEQVGPGPRPGPRRTGPDRPGPAVAPPPLNEHVALHAIVAEQLWTGEPPQVWAAAKRLAAGGMDRHEVLHRLTEALRPHVADPLADRPSFDLGSYVDALAGLAARAVRSRGSGPPPAPRRSSGGSRGRAATGADAGSYQVKITLRGTKPPIWRRVLAPATVTLADLHHIIQCAMGWTDSHLHQFEVGALRFGVPDPDGVPMRDETEVRLCDVAEEVGSRLRYEYDFGDGWEHDVVVEKIFAEGVPVASCLGGRRACPPEDCGGVYGYAELLRVLADPTHDEHEQLLTWLGGEVIDPATLHLEEINAGLRDLRLSTTG